MAAGRSADRLAVAIVKAAGMLWAFDAVVHDQPIRQPCLLTRANPSDVEVCGIRSIFARAYGADNSTLEGPHCGR